ncbi:MAG: efflux RND transporter periplasmic adaptor subunit [Acidobacteriota bacterium]
MSPSRFPWKALAPLAVLAVASTVAFIMIKAHPRAQKRPSRELSPLVRIQYAKRVDRRLTVRSQGTVSPRTQSSLMAEVPGRVVSVAPSFAPGGFFRSGDVLLTVDPLDYREAVIRITAEVARSRLNLAREEAEAEIARREWKDLAQATEATPLTLHELQVAEARAALAAAEADLGKARRDLERTRVRAPYNGRVREKLVDVGQFVMAGTPLATIYAVDFAEVRLPLPDSDLAFLDLPLAFRRDPGSRSGPRITLRAIFTGQVHTWQGRIVRTEGEIDPTSRLVHVVARVKEPYRRRADPDSPPLAVGMFVEAEIEGKLLHDVIVLPRAALRADRKVLIIDEENRLRFRRVDLVRTTRTEIIVRSGLADGDRVCLSPLEAVTDGMRVRTIASDRIAPSTPSPGATP